MPLKLDIGCNHLRSFAYGTHDFCCGFCIHNKSSREIETICKGNSIQLSALNARKTNDAHSYWRPKILQSNHLYILWWFRNVDNFSQVAAPNHHKQYTIPSNGWRLFCIQTRNPLVRASLFWQRRQQSKRKWRKGIETQKISATELKAKRK